MTKQAGAIIKHSLEARLKRRAQRHPEIYPEYGYGSSSRLFEQIKGTQFWRWDLPLDVHKELYKSNKCGCFNCLVGWAKKNDVELPLFDYEKTLIDAVERDRYILVRKSSGLGITTLMLRWAAHLCLKDDSMRGKEMAVIVGPNLNLAIGLIDKIKSLFLQHGITFDSKATSVTLNQCQINAYPSNHLDAMRSRMDLKVIMVDELEFFEPGERAILRDVVERNLSKSSPRILMVSTPGLDPSNSLMKQIEEEEPSIYRKFVMDWTVGLGKIYSDTDIQLAKRSPSWGREMCCEYGGYSGNIFSLESIHRAVQIEGIKYDPVTDYRPDARHCIGIDCGFSTSKFAITVLQASAGKIQVLAVEEHSMPDFNIMLHHTVNLMKKYYRVNNVIIDGANVSFIASLKRMIGENPNYQDHRKELEHRYPGTPINRHLRIVPVSFNSAVSGGKFLLQNTKSFLDDSRGLVQIHPSFTILEQALKSATANEYKLDKPSSPENDVLDATFLAMSYFIYQPEGATK